MGFWGKLGTVIASTAVAGPIGTAVSLVAMNSGSKEKKEKPSRGAILEEARIQGVSAAALASGNVAGFVMCVLAKVMTKPLPEAVAECIPEFF